MNQSVADTIDRALQAKTTLEFDEYFKNYPFLKKQFAGVFAIDNLPKTLKIKING